jgi:CheY-like chemotaxis protein
MDRETKSILLVDGSTTMLYYHGILLERLEYAVQMATSAESALAAMERAMPSLVLTEISLPLMSGVGLIEKLKLSDRTNKIPVVVLTGERDEKIKAACLGMGCAGYLFKPVEPDLLYRTIQAVLEFTPREHIRLATRLKIVVGDGSSLGGSQRTEYATAISEGGLYVRTLYPQPKNALTPVRITIKGREIEAKAVVLYSYTMEGGPFKEPGMGMKFVEISPKDRELVRSFIREQLTRDISNDLASEREK